MSENNYFRFLPEFDYITRGRENLSADDYTRVKNLFVRGYINDEIYGQITIFDRYIIEGDDRPDTVAYKLYNDPNLDWTILLSNNILNVYSEWPLSKQNFDSFLLEKYGSYSKAYETRYYETLEIKNSDGVVLLPAGLKVSSQYIDFDEKITVERGTGEFDIDTGEEILEIVTIDNPNYLKLKPTYFRYFDTASGKDITYTEVIKSISNYDYELKINEEKRQIYVLKKEYMGIILDQIEEIFQYKEGSRQYVSESLKKGITIN